MRTRTAAVLLKQRMPDATRVRVVFRSDRTAMTRGTIASILEMMPSGILIRDNGRLREAPEHKGLADITFREGTGRELTLYLEMPQGYAVTVLFALACVQRALQSDAPTGAMTPSQLIGTDAMLSIPGVQQYAG